MIPGQGTIVKQHLDYCQGLRTKDYCQRSRSQGGQGVGVLELSPVKGTRAPTAREWGRDLICFVVYIAHAQWTKLELISSNQAIALQSLSLLTSLFRKKTRQDDASESTLVEEGGQNLLLSLGNVLHSAAQKASVIGVANFSKDVQNKVIN